MPNPTGFHWGWARGPLWVVVVAGTLCLAAPDAWAQGLRGVKQTQGHLDSVLKKLVGRSSLKSADVDVLIRQANNDLRISQNHMFNGRHQEASALLDKVVGMPIQVLGLVIKPGDLLHGDENGLLKVPLEGLEALAQRVTEVGASERPLMEFVRSPEFSLEKLRGKLVE